MKYEVESGIEMPVARRGRKPKYPFREMNVGDSFEIRDDKFKDTQNASNVYGHRTKKKFTIRTMPDQTRRCFRLE